MMTLEPLSEEAIRSELASLPGWHFSGSALGLELEFKSFRHAFAFMTAAALVSERQNHHPDWWNSYRTVRIEVMSHDCGGVTSRDIRWAREIAQLVHEYEGSVVTKDFNQRT